MKILFILLLFVNIALANVDGVDIQLFNPTTNAIDFITVQSSKVLPPMIFNTGFYLNGSFNSLSKKMDKISDFLLSSDINAGFGVVEGLDVGVSIPAALHHMRDDTFQGYYLDTRGINEIRVNSKLNLMSEPFGMAVIGLVNFPLSNGNPYTGDSKKPIYNLEFAFDRAIDRYKVAFNLGYRFRKQNSGPNAMMTSDQLIYSLGTSYYSENNLKYIAELVGATRADKPFDSEKNSPLEIRGTLRKDLYTDFSLLAGIGFGIQKGLSAPIFRVYSGINYNFGHKEVAPVVKKKTAKIKHYVFQLNFLYNTTKMYFENKSIFKDLIKTIKKSVVKKIIIIGHTDSVGTDEYNLKLSKGRARVIRDYLVEQGISKKKIKAFGRGESKPIADNSNYMGRKKNRRVEIKLIGKFKD